MMDAIRDILRAHGYPSIEGMDIGDHVEIEHDDPGMMPLVIEKVGEHRVSVAHYYTQRGDLMADPDIVFHITTDGTWVPIEYTQHPHIYQHNEAGLPGAKAFAETWSRNLQRQGYVDAAGRA